MIKIDSPKNNSNSTNIYFFHLLIYYDLNFTSSCFVPLPILSKTKWKSCKEENFCSHFLAIFIRLSAYNGKLYASWVQVDLNDNERANIHFSSTAIMIAMIEWRNSRHESRIGHFKCISTSKKKKYCFFLPLRPKRNNYSLFCSLFVLSRPSRSVQVIYFMWLKWHFWRYRKVLVSAKQKTFSFRSFCRSPFEIRSNSRAHTNGRKYVK